MCPRKTAGFAVVRCPWPRAGHVGAGWESRAAQPSHCPLYLWKKGVAAGRNSGWGKLPPHANIRIHGTWLRGSCRVWTNTLKSAPWPLSAIAWTPGFSNPWEGTSFFPSEAWGKWSQKTASVYWLVSKTPPMAGSSPQGKPLGIQDERKLSVEGFEEGTLSSAGASTPLYHLAMSGMKLFIV